MVIALSILTGSVNWLLNDLKLVVELNFILFTKLSKCVCIWRRITNPAKPEYNQCQCCLILSRLYFNLNIFPCVRGSSYMPDNNKNEDNFIFIDFKLLSHLWWILIPKHKTIQSKQQYFTGESWPTWRGSIPLTSDHGSDAVIVI